VKRKRTRKGSAARSAEPAKVDGREGLERLAFLTRRVLAAPKPKKSKRKE
jgi:hypothetical protein